MKLTPEQLDGHLKRALLPVYLLSGDEPLLMQDEPLLSHSGSSA